MVTLRNSPILRIMTTLLIQWALRVTTVPDSLKSICREELVLLWTSPVMPSKVQGRVILLRAIYELVRLLHSPEDGNVTLTCKNTIKYSAAVTL